jgi:trimethylamine:corrinoid methyltransferase-like protein
VSLLGTISRVFSGMRVDEEAMTLEVIAKIGPHGHFLGRKAGNEKINMSPSQVGWVIGDANGQHSHKERTSLFNERV